MEKERVIFRREWNPYWKQWNYLACFPDDEACYGRLCMVPIWFNNDIPWHGAYGEMSWEYYYETKPVRKKEKELVNKLVTALQLFYGGEYRVYEKVVR